LGKEFAVIAMLSICDEFVDVNLVPVVYQAIARVRLEELDYSLQLAYLACASILVLVPDFLILSYCGGCGGVGVGDLQTRYKSRKRDLYPVQINLTCYLANLFPILEE
jgi:hypothetical protein